MRKIQVELSSSWGCSGLIQILLFFKQTKKKGLESFVAFIYCLPAGWFATFLSRKKLKIREK